jgi:hypothetical protein
VMTALVVMVQQQEEVEVAGQMVLILRQID